MTGQQFPEEAEAAAAHRCGLLHHEDHRTGPAGRPVERGDPAPAAQPNGVNTKENSAARASSRYSGSTPGPQDREPMPCTA
jgi:hypothetical protein